MQDKILVVEGEIYFTEVDSSFSGAMVYVKLEDVSRADAPSQMVAQEVLRNVSLDMENPRPVLYSMRCPALDERRRYSLAVHVAIRGKSELVERGDYITMESYPVEASRSHTRLNVRVRPVR